VTRPWCTIAPLTADRRGLNFDLAEPFDLGNRVALSPRPDWLTRESITKNLGWVQREVLIGQARYALRVDYEAASLGDPDPSWKGEARSIQDTSAECLYMANVALWLARPSPAAFGLVVHAEKHDDEWVHRQSFFFDSVKVHENDQRNGLGRHDLTQARTLNVALAGLPRDGAPWASARVLWKALTEDWWEGRYLLLWVALEALFGPLSPGETTYRLSQNLAFFLTSNAGEAHTTFRAAKESYEWRSKIVHGMRLARLPKEKSSELLYRSESFVRRALVRILSERTLIELFSSNKRREEFLSTIPFSRPQEH